MLTPVPAAMRINIDGGKLADTAMERSPSLAAALHWLLYVWRSAPDSYERAVRDEAEKRITHRMTEDEYAAWQHWQALPPLDRPPLT